MFLSKTPYANQHQQDTSQGIVSDHLDHQGDEDSGHDNFNALRDTRSMSVWSGKRRRKKIGTMKLFRRETKIGG